MFKDDNCVLVRMFLKKVIEIDAFHRKKGGLFLRSDRSGPSNTVDDGHFAEKILGQQNCKHRLSGLPQVFNDLDRSLTDNKHPIARFAFPDNDIVLVKHRFFDSTRNFQLSAVVVSPAKIGMACRNFDA